MSDTPSIRLLEDQVINQIAAGEVVERPASVVKELVENSLDAGATVLEVRLRSGGTELVRIIDDGIGMSRADAMMCLERHATSKIRSADDLFDVRSLGFRGEAIPSIASVSRFQITTRPADHEVGTQIRIEAGTIQSVRDGGGPAGTDIAVRELFYNLPARRKFLRTAQTELSHCTEAVVREVLLRPDVDVTVSHNGREVLRAPATESLLQRARDLLGDAGRGLIEVEYSADGVRVHGLASPIAVHRPTGAQQYLYINGRYVRDPVVRRGVNEAYRERLPRKRYPVLVLDVGLDPHTVDVNVHPQKTEVRFRDPRRVSRVIAEALRAALDGAGEQRHRSTLGPLWTGPTAEPRPRPLPAALPLPPPAPGPSIAAHPDDDPSIPNLPWLVQDAPTPSAPSAVPEPAPSIKPTTEDAGPEATPRPSTTPQPPSDHSAPAEDAAGHGFRKLQVIGPAGGFLLCADARGLVALDLERAEGVLYLHRSRRQRPAERTIARFLTPEKVEVGRGDMMVLEGRLGLLDALGLQLQAFDGSTMLVRGVPAALAEVPLGELFVRLARCPEQEAEQTLARVHGEHARAREGMAQWRSLLASLDEIEAPHELGRLLGHFDWSELQSRVNQR